MNRRTFLKGAAFGIGGIFAATASPAIRSLYGAALPANDDQPGFIHPTLASNSRQPVGTRLICFYDVSGSIDNAEHDVQIEVMADAIGSDDFRNAIFYPGGPQSISICIAEFSSNSYLRVPWLDIRKGDDAKLKTLARQILALKRDNNGGTNHVSALEYSSTLFDQCPWQGKRSIVDLLTDGVNNESSDAEARLKSALETLAIRHEATVNALITLDQDRNLEEWARANIVTPPGFRKRDGSPLDAGFVKVVATQQTDKGAIVKYKDTMKMAFRRKLILEVAGIEIEDLYKPGIYPALNIPRP